MPVGVNTAMQSDQTPGPKHLLDTAGTEADVRKLVPGQDAPLATSNLLHPG